MRDDRDRQISQVQTLSTEIVKFKDSSEKSGSELDNLTMKTKELEVGFLSGFVSVTSFLVHNLLSFR